MTFLKLKIGKLLYYINNYCLVIIYSYLLFIMNNKSLIEYKTLKNKYFDRECVILSCGPSLKEYDRDVIIDLMKDKIVFCVKEAVIEFKEHCDYFFYNDSRMRNYEFDDKTIKIYQSKIGKRGNVIDYDIILNEDSPFKVETQLLKIHNFDKYNLDNTNLRPWGPGILYETVFYMCLYMGFKKVYTIGWDLIDISKSKNIEHFFENDRSNKYKSSERWNYDFRNEMKLVHENTQILYNYFKSMGLDIIVCGHKSFVDKCIPRIYL